MDKKQVNTDYNKWRIVGTSVTGTGHLKSGLPCQDSFHYRVIDSDKVIISVSDGAGSAKKALEGSSLIVKKSVELLDNHLKTKNPDCETEWKNLIKEVFQETRQYLIDYALNSQTPLRDYGATLILTVLTPEWTIGALIGDCASAGLNSKGELFSLCTPQKGEYINMTNFITQDNASDVLDIQIRKEPVQSIAVFSDGLLELALNVKDNIPFHPFFKPLFDFVISIDNEEIARRQLEIFLNSDRISSRTDDDKTLVLGVKERKNGS